MGATQEYRTDDGDKLLSVKQGTATVKSYGYDAAGRTTSVVSSAGTTTLTYDFESRVKSISGPGVSNSFTYNGLDTRVGKVDSSGTATYRRDGAEVTDDVLSDGGAVYTPGVSQRRAGATTYDLSDRLGSATRQTDAAKATTATRSYDAFGILLASTGTPKGPFGFAGGHGYQEEGDTGLKLLGHRVYDPSTGRFLTRDPAKDGRNWVAYCEGNPTAGVDANGFSLTIVKETDKDAEGRGFSEQEREKIEADIKELRKTKRGRLILDALEQDAIDHRIEKGSGREVPSTDGKDVTLRPDQKRIIEVDNNNGGRFAPFDGARELAHELAHVAFGTGDDGPTETRNIEENENPVAKELKLPRRTSYLWWLFDPGKRLYFDPAHPNAPGVRFP